VRVFYHAASFGGFARDFLRVSSGSRGSDARATYLLVQPEAVRLVRSVYDVLQVLPHELEELLEHLLNLGLLERPHDAPGSRAPRRAFG
jgi:hypothetical protein